MDAPTPQQWQLFEGDGVVPLPGALALDELARLQAAFARCAEAARPRWLEQVAEGTQPAAFFDIPDPLAQDALFLDLVDHPSWYGHLLAFSGAQITFIGAQFRTVPPSPLSGPYPLVGDLRHMPGHRVYPGAAGTALLFNSYGLHTSMVNRSPRGRRSIILIYEVASDRSFDPEAFARFAGRLTTPDRRQLFRRERRPPAALAAP